MTLHEKSTPLTAIVDQAAKLAGGDEWHVPVSIEQDDGSLTTETITVIANSEEEAADAAIARAKMLYVDRKVKKPGLIGKVVAAPYTKEKSIRTFMPGGYKPGTLLKGSFSDMVSMLKRNKENAPEDRSTVATEIRCRNSFISMCLHMLIIPVGFIFLYAGIFTDAPDRSALGYLNQYVWAGALCLFVGATGAYRSGRDMARLEKTIQSENENA